MLRPRLRIPRPSRLWRPAILSRSLHQVPILPHFNPEEGVPGLLSEGGFDLAWTQYMDLIIGKLNALTYGTDFEQAETLTIIKATAREPSQASIFNYASMAHNNAMFFDKLVNVNLLGTSGQDRIPPGLAHDLIKQFSSIETLRLEFIATASAMFGPGFVWLVKNAQSPDMRILTTYLAGTPYTAGHWRRQGVDMNVQGFDSQDTVRGWLERTKTGAGADTGSKFVLQNQTAPGGTDVIPLLCLNTWEHVWLRDYGIGAKGIGGKEQFVQNWWECIDWVKVDADAKTERPALKQ
ncbi:hypothetical protein AAE478_000142 [Parahypoxylon ruwenzoriense]